VEIIGCPIVREADGLAKSSRNTYLSPEERKAAVILSKAVNLGRDMMNAGERDALRVLDSMRKLIESEPLARIDYVSMVDSATMKDVENIEGSVLCAMAVYLGKTRLIDNFTFEG